MSARNRRRLWEPAEDKQLREMVEAGKSPTMIALRLKRTVAAVRGRLTVLRITIRRVHIKKNPPGGIPDLARFVLDVAEDFVVTRQRGVQFGMGPRSHFLADAVVSVDLLMAMGDHRPALPHHRDKRAKAYPLVDQNILAPRLLGAGCGVFLRQCSMGLDLREDRISFARR